MFLQCLAIATEHFSPEWNQAKVQTWLERVKQSNELDFEVQTIAVPGVAFKKFNQDQLIAMTGNKLAGIVIFNERETPGILLFGFLVCSLFCSHLHSKIWA